MTLKANPNQGDKLDLHEYLSFSESGKRPKIAELRERVDVFKKKLRRLLTEEELFIDANHKDGFTSGQIFRLIDYFNPEFQQNLSPQDNGGFFKSVLGNEFAPEVIDPEVMAQAIEEVRYGIMAEGMGLDILDPKRLEKIDDSAGLYLESAELEKLFHSKQFQERGADVLGEYLCSDSILGYVFPPPLTIPARFLLDEERIQEEIRQYLLVAQPSYRVEFENVPTMGFCMIISKSTPNKEAEI